MRVRAPVEFSVRIYTRLLAVYPGRFRAEYGPHMAQVFRDVCRRDYVRGGLAGMTSLWARTALDLIRTTAEEHIERGLDMSRETFVRWSGWSLIAGAILFAAGLVLGSLDPQWSDPIGGTDAVYEIGQIVASALGQLLFVVGLIGLRAGFAQRSGSLGSALLLVGAAGSVVSLIGVAFMQVEGFGWYAWMFGMLAMTLALFLFGVVALRRRVFARWNFAPILAGVVLPTMVAASLILDGSKTPQPEWMLPVGLAVTTLGFVLVGYRMQAEAGRAAATTA